MRQHIAQYRAHDHTLGFGELHRARRNTMLRIERTPGALVGDKFRAADHADTAGLADQRVLAECREPVLEVRRKAGGSLENLVALINLERLERDCRRDRM